MEHRTVRVYDSTQGKKVNIDTFTYHQYASIRTGKKKEQVGKVKILELSKGYDSSEEFTSKHYIREVVFCDSAKEFLILRKEINPQSAITAPAAGADITTAQTTWDRTSNSGNYVYFFIIGEDCVLYQRAGAGKSKNKEILDWLMEKSKSHEEVYNTLEAVKKNIDNGAFKGPIEEGKLFGRLQEIYFEKYFTEL